MKKICHISGTTLSGGGPEHIYQLSKRLNRKEWDIIICTLKDGLYWDKFNSIGIKTYNLALRVLSLKTAYKLFLILRKENPDLIHTHGKGPGLYGRIISRFLNIPTIHTFHGFHYEDIPVFTRWLHLSIETFLSLFTDQHIFVSHGEKKRAHVLKFVNEENSIVIHNGVDHEYICDLSITRKAALNIARCENWETNKILGTIARLSPEKGILYLLSAFCKALQEIPDLRLLIVGGCPKEHKNYYLKINNFIEKENLAEHIRILNYQKDTIKILKCMDFYVSPSLSEGMPISMLEACASKTPTIATEITGNKDILRNSVFGVLVKPESTNSLAQGIIKMVKLSQAERDIITRNAFNRIKIHFTVEKMVNKTTLLYNQVINKKHV